MNNNLKSPEIIAKLRQVTSDEFYGANREDLTVRLVRDQVERVFGLEKNFLRSKDWNSKSKDIIKACVQELLELEEEDQERQNGSTNCDERTSEVQTSFVEGPKNIQQEMSHLTNQEPYSKNVCTSEIDKDDDNRAGRTLLKPCTESSEESEELSRRCRLDYEKLASKRRRLVKRGSNHKSSFLKSDDKKKEQTTQNNENCTANFSNLSPSNSTVTHSNDRSTGKPTKSGTTKLLDSCLNSSDVTREKDEIEQIKAEEFSNLVSTRNKKSNEVQGKLLPDQEEASNSDTSIVYDEPPSKTKRKKSDGDNFKNDKRIKRTHHQRHEARKNKDPSILSSDEAAIKNLQSQLRKCGTRKNWSSELKEYGSDTKAKIRHLKRALEAIGMKGRFSEAKARNIKEARELMADVQAVQEGEKKWGLKPKMEKSKRSKSPMRKREDNDNDEHAHDKKAKLLAKQEDDNLSDELSLENRSKKQGDTRGNKMARISSSRSKSKIDSASTLIRKRPSIALDWLQDEEDSDE